MDHGDFDLLLQDAEFSTLISGQYSAVWTSSILCTAKRVLVCKAGGMKHVDRSQDLTEIYGGLGRCWLYMNGGHQVKR